MASNLLLLGSAGVLVIIDFSCLHINEFSQSAERGSVHFCDFCGPSVSVQGRPGTRLAEVLAYLGKLAIEHP